MICLNQTRLAASFALTLLLVPMELVAEEAKAPDQQGEQQAGEGPQGSMGTGQRDIYEGAIGITGEGVSENAIVVGGHLGSETVEGLDVGLYVLQAESWERLKPGGKGPTHMFNVTISKSGEGNLITQALGAVVVKGTSGEQRVPFKSFERHFQSLLRLDEEGIYQVSVEFVSQGQKGATKSFPFTYKRKKPEQSAGK